MLEVEERNGRVRFKVRVQPRASRSEVVGLHGDALKVRVTAPPVDGAANEALVDLFSRLFAVGRGAVRIVAGQGSRSKVVEIDGVTSDRVRHLTMGSQSP